MTSWPVYWWTFLPQSLISWRINSFPVIEDPQGYSKNLGLPFNLPYIFTHFKIIFIFKSTTTQCMITDASSLLSTLLPSYLLSVLREQPTIVLYSSHMLMVLSVPTMSEHYIEPVVKQINCLVTPIWVPHDFIRRFHCESLMSTDIIATFSKH